MARQVDLFDSTYRNFTSLALDAIRKETFGDDIGQNSWLTSDEFDRFVSWLDLAPGHHVLEIASGSGGPARHLARTIGCRVTGVDVNLAGVGTASEMAAQSNVARQVDFGVADANAGLPFADASFDAVLCIDSMNHLPDRLAVLREWHRLLRPGRRALYTDPVVIAGPVTNEELALRSSIGLFVFMPPGVNEQIIEQAGFRLARQEDVTGNAALVAGRWHRARAARKQELLRIEGAERFEGLQAFFDTVHRLMSQRRLSRIAYLIKRQESPA